MPFKYKSTYFFVIFAWLLLVTCGFVYSIYFVGEQTDEDIRDSFNIQFIDDTSNPMSIEEVDLLPDRIFADDKRIIHKPDSLDFSMWYKITTKSETEEGRFATPFSITVDNPTLDSIHFYVHYEGKVVFEKQLGDQNQAKYAIDHVSPQISLFGGMSNKTKIYIRIKTNGAPATPILIEDIQKSQFRTNAQLILLGALFGIGVIMIIYNFFMFRGVGDLSYLHYIMYVAGAVISISMINGFTFFMMPSEFSMWANKYLIIPIHTFALIYAIKFAISFLRFETVKPWFVKIGENLCIALALFGVASLFFAEGTMLPLYFIGTALGYTYALALMAMVFKSRLIWVRYYLISWIPLLAGTIVTMAAYNGSLPYNFFTKNASLLGVMFEVCIMALALLDRFRANQLDRDYRINHDLATGLPNQMLLESAIKNVAKSSQSMALGVFEITQTKDVIPALGTETANKFFSRLFQSIHEYICNLDGVYTFATGENRQPLHIVRIDESRFAVLFIGVIDDQEIEHKVKIIQDAAASIVEVNGLSMSVSTAAGVASYPEDTQDPDKLLSTTMQALNVGRTVDQKWARYDEQRSTDIKQKFRLAADLQAAIEEDELDLYHQPQIDLVTNRVHGSELLLRWIHPVDGFISPAYLVEIAEEMGVIHQLTEWVITKGFQQHSKLYKLGFETNVSINISGKDFNDNGLVAHILTCAAKFGVIPSTVTLEVTESATAEDPKHAQKVLSELYQQGFKIAIDDFGTGYSSLDYLSQLPFHELKIDKCFMNIDASERNRTITEVTLLLAKKLGVNAVAEGIENEQVAKMVKEFGCPVGQGYLYSKPKPFIEYMRWLQELYKKDRNLCIDADG